MADQRMTLLEILARIRPEVWEIIGGGPLGAHASHLLGPWALGPLPEPWRWAAGPLPEPWVLASQLTAVDLSRRILDAASLTQTQGSDGPGLLKRILDDDGWGIEGRPPEIRLPREWWKHDIPHPPRPNEIDDLGVAVLAAAGLSFIQLSRRIDDEPPSTAAAETGLQILDTATDYASTV